MPTAVTLNRDGFFANFDVRSAIRPVPLPDQTQVYIRELSGAGADAFGSASSQSPELARASLVVACVCDERGELVFQPSDVGRVALLPNRVLTPIVEAIIRQNGLSAEAAREAVPTSANDLLNDSGLDSPETLDAVLPN